MGLLLGVDIGSASSKGVLARPDGTVVATAVREHALSTPRPGWVEHDAERVWWGDFTGIARELAGAADEPVVAVGVSGIGPCLLVTDRDGTPLRPAILYGIDTRAVAEIAELTASYGEQAIIERVLAGETRAFALLIDAHKDNAMTLALRMLKNREDAEEALQDAFVRAFRSLGRFEGKSKFATWLYRIVFNVCASRSRRRELHEVRIDDAPSDEMPIAADRPDILCEGAEFQRIVADAIDALPPVYGAIFTLYAVNEMSYEEIAEVADLPINTVKTRLFRARALLRTSVADRMGEPGRGLQATMKEKR